MEHEVPVKYYIKATAALAGIGSNVGALFGFAIGSINRYVQVLDLGTSNILDSTIKGAFIMTAATVLFAGVAIDGIIYDVFAENRDRNNRENLINLENFANENGRDIEIGL